MITDNISLREYIDLQFAARDKALSLQAIEIHRRLDALNGEQTRIALDRERFLTREIYDEYHRDIEKWRETINSYTAVSSGRDRGISLVWVVLLALVGVGLSVALYFK